LVAVKAAEVDRAVRSRGPDIAVLLFYGPDSGRVAERARLAAEAATDDPADPFQLIRMDGDTLADEPTRLVEEATTFGMFGGRRAIWVRPTSRNITASVAACLEVKLVDTVIVIEAGDLKTSPLRTLCEKAPNALALPSYADDAKDVAAVVTETLRSHNLSIGDEARQLLVQSLGGDRLATRSELNKLALYAHGKGEVTVDDVEAAVSDVSALALDAAIDAAFAGNVAALDEGLTHLMSHGTNAAQILAIVLRHAMQLLGGVNALSKGDSPDHVLRSWRGLHFRRKDAIGRQLRGWTSTALMDAVDKLQAAVLETRRAPNLAPTLTSRVLIGLAETARRARQR
jgi:DNA polymerase-3 subunit delta